MKKLAAIIPVILILTLMMASSGMAQEAAKWSAKPATATVKAGATVEVKVTADVTDGWHIYSTTPQDEGPEPTDITFPENAPLSRAGKIKQPKPITKYDENFGVNTEYYAKDVTFTVTAKVKANAKPGKQKVIVEVYFMACNDRMCLPPKTVEIPMDLTIEAGDAVQAASEEMPADGDLTEVITQVHNMPDASS